MGAVTEPLSGEAVLEFVRRRELEDRAAVDRFAAAVWAGDLPAMVDLLDTVDRRGLMKRAFVKAAAGPVAPLVRERFPVLWADWGDGMRSEVNDDLALIKILRAFLPPYGGPAVTLYRGDGAFNQRRRTYGLSWSESREVADGFARGAAKVYEHGGVLLCCEVPASAIICAIHELLPDWDEGEFLVDRRRLNGVHVIARYPASELRAPAFLLGV